MKTSRVVGLALLAAAAFTARTTNAGEVAIFTAQVNWISKSAADDQADICMRRLEAADIDVQWFGSPDLDIDAGDDVALAAWLEEHTDNGETDVLVLYGWFPDGIYPSGNTSPDGSAAEAFIESEDGDAIINHADWAFYVSSTINGVAGLENMMDVPGASMGGPDNTPMVVTDVGRAIAPNLSDFSTDRPMHLETLGGEWTVEVALAEGADPNRSEPVILRDGTRGRIVPVYQTNQQNDPKGAVAAEIIAYLFEISLVPTTIGISGETIALTDRPARLQVSLADETGTPTPGENEVTVSLSSDSATGRFDVDPNGPFDGSITSVDLLEGSIGVTVYYRDSDSGVATITGSGEGFSNGSHEINVLEDESGEPGQVAIYTGATSWIAKAEADAEAQICADKLDLLGADALIFDDASQDADLLAWLEEATENGEVDVLVTFGFFPGVLYPSGNVMPDDSPAELFLESTDGDMIINVGDYAFYVSNPNNEVRGLENVMDIIGITMWGDNTPLTVTPTGAAKLPSLTDFLTDRPFHIDELQNNWFAERVYAQDATGARADPVIVRDGNLGRIGIAYQTANQDDPKGSVVAEMVADLYGLELGEASQLSIFGRTAAYANDSMALTVEIQTDTGSPSPATTETTIVLATSSGTGAFDVDPDGAFDGSVTAVTLPVGQARAPVYYRDSAPGSPTLSVSTGGLDGGSVEVRVFERSIGPAGEVAIFTGSVRWIGEPEADAQARITHDTLLAADVNVQWFGSPDVDLDAGDETALLEWLEEHTGDGRVDVLILYGYTPDSLYPSPNVMPEGSPLELYLESTDGDAVINHADYMFYVSSMINGTEGIANLTDVPGLTMWDDNTPMVVTPEGAEIAPSLFDYLTDRPIHLDELAGDWLAEVVLAQNAAGTRADPAIVRDGDRGRLIPVFQTNQQNDPKGAVAAEIVAWLLDSSIRPTGLSLSGPNALATGARVSLTVSVVDAAGVPRPSDQDTTISLETSADGTGAFDTSWAGDFDGSIVSVTIPAGETSIRVYYTDSAPGDVTFRATGTSGPELEGATFQTTVLEDLSGGAGRVLIYTGDVNWILPFAANPQARACVDELTKRDIDVEWIDDSGRVEEVADFVREATGNGMVDVLIIYGYFPDSIYAAPNVDVDGSLAELFLESTDGDAIINHADYFGYVSSTNNEVFALQNLTDNPVLTMWGDNDAMIVTEAGQTIAPSILEVPSDRPLHIDELADQWFVEAALAENAAGTRADPVIARDGNRGRIIPVYQSAFQDDPKGLVAAEIVAYLFSGDVKCEGPDCPQDGIHFLRGDVDGNLQLLLNDAIQIFGWLFQGGREPPCIAAADSSSQGDVNLTSGIFILNFLFTGGAAPQAPYPVCGSSTNESDLALGCLEEACAP